VRRLTGIMAGGVAFALTVAGGTTSASPHASLPRLPGSAAFGRDYRPATAKYVVGDCRVFHRIPYGTCESAAYMIAMTSRLAQEEPISVSVTVMGFVEVKQARQTMAALEGSFQHGTRVALRLPVTSDVRIVANRAGHVTDALLYHGHVVAFVGLFGMNRLREGARETYDLLLVSRALTRQ
jgi:hypothetical protein